VFTVSGVIAELDPKSGLPDFGTTMIEIGHPIDWQSSIHGRLGDRPSRAMTAQS
jgi:hypothetical protein